MMKDKIIEFVCYFVLISMGFLLIIILLETLAKGFGITFSVPLIRARLFVSFVFAIILLHFNSKT